MATSSQGLTKPASTRPAHGFARFAWFVVLYLLAVILFGAWVRITGSGAGCGNHWPTCHGDVLPRSAALETLIEYTHRATSGLLGLFVVGLAGWAWASRQPRRVRIGATVTFALVLVEAAIGAGLVLNELVARDDSIARAIVIALHLANTFALTAAAALTAFAASPDAIALPTRARSATALLAAALAAVLIVSMTGAITALGDTLFPVDPTESNDLFGRLRTDLSPAAHFLVRLRVVHPLLAVALTVALLGLPAYLDAPRVGPIAARLVDRGRWAALGQAGIGVLNIWLGAPGWLQLLHLLAAQCVWLLLVLAMASAPRISPPDPFPNQ